MKVLPIPQVGEELNEPNLTKHNFHSRNRLNYMYHEVKVFRRALNHQSIIKVLIIRKSTHVYPHVLEYALLFLLCHSMSLSAVSLLLIWPFPPGQAVVLLSCCQSSENCDKPKECQCINEAAYNIGPGKR